MKSGRCRAPSRSARARHMCACPLSEDEFGRGMGSNCARMNGHVAQQLGRFSAVGTARMSTGLRKSRDNSDEKADIAGSRKLISIRTVLHGVVRFES